MLLLEIIVKEIRIFIASSIKEFELVRNYIGDYIRRYENSVKDVYIRLNLCEDEELSSQPVYDRLIERCHIFIGIIGRRIGQYTLHEVCEIANTERGKDIYSKNLFISKDQINSKALENLTNTFDVQYFNDEEIHDPQFILAKLHSILEKSIDNILKENRCSDHTSPLTTLAPIVNIPSYSANYEYAIISNSIRVLIDRGNQIIVKDGETEDICDKYIAVLSNIEQDERDRVIHILSSAQIDNNNLWFFAQKHIIDPSIQEIYKQIVDKYHIYPDSFTDYEKFTLLVKNRLLELVVRNCDYFLYEVHDHWLYQKGQILGRQIPIQSLIWDEIEAESLQQQRRERVITNVLNFYITTKNRTKYLEALQSLESKNYDFFIYIPKTIRQLSTDTIEAYIDYINDRQEQICRIAYNQDNIQVLKDGIKELGDFVDSIQHFQLTHLDQFYLNFTWGHAFLYFNDRKNAIYHFKQSFENSSKIDKTDNDVVEEATILCIVRICELYYEEEMLSFLVVWTSERRPILNEIKNKYLYYYILFLVYQARANKDTNPATAIDCYNEALTLLAKEDLYNENNFLLNLYIELVLEYILYDFYKNNCDLVQYDTTVKNLQREYNKYLSTSNNYKLSKSYLRVLNGLIYKNIKALDEAISILRAETELTDSNLQLWEARYYRTLVLRESFPKEAADDYATLITDRKDSIRAAACYQNIADIYIDLKKFEDAFDAYNNAIDIYQKDVIYVEKLGNCYDGLAWAHILNHNFKKAEEDAMKSVSIAEYSAYNKYCNLISALLCQKRYFAAFKVYRGLGEYKCSVKKQLIENDWKDMEHHGINTTFFKFFLF